MKITVFVATLFLASVSCYPAQDSKEDASLPEIFDFVPLDKRGQFRPPFPDSDEDFGDEPIVDTGYFDSYFRNPFSGLFASIENMLTRMRHQLATALNHVPESNGTFIVSPIGDLGKGNTTSVTKIIDGHKVVINETEYKKEGEHGGAYVKISVINVLPQSSETTEPDTELVTRNPARDRESLEDSLENEIPKTEENDFLVETFDVDSKPGADSKWHGVEDLQPIRDLSNDIDVNQYMADAGAPFNPDAEFIDIINEDGAYKNLKRPKFEKLIIT